MLKPRNFLERHGVLCFGLLATALCIAATALLGARHPPDLLETANKLGPTARSLVEGRGLAVCHGPEGSMTCLHAQRMPLAPLTLAALYLLFHEHGFLAASLKAVLFFAPVLFAFALAWRHAPSWQLRRATFSIFLLALLLPPTLDTAVNLNFEEAYFYSLLALAVALLLFPEESRRHPRRWTALLLLSAALPYLTKSAMLLSSSFLVLMAAIYVARSLRRPAWAIALLLSFACVPVLWGVSQHHTSGRFTVGTSLDGVNLYKGNNPFFLERYPPFRGASQDIYEASLFAGRVSPIDEWDANNFGLASAKSYVRAHPLQTVHADLRKAFVFFFGIQRNAGEAAYSPFLETAFTVGLILARLLLLSTILLALRQLIKRREGRFPALVFLGLVFCVAVPYVLGFALTRHASVLTLPAAAYLCQALHRFLPAEA